MIGSICLWNFSEDQKTAEIGYDLSPDYQGKGIMHESLCRIIEFGFQNLNLEFIEAFTHYKNEPSKKLLENNGFKLVPGKKDEDRNESLNHGRPLRRRMNHSDTKQASASRKTMDWCHMGK